MPREWRYQNPYLVDRSQYYILDKDGQTLIPIYDSPMRYADWADSMGLGGLIVNRTVINEDIYVSTVFLGINHNYGSGEPVLWETIIFGGPHDGEEWRYMSYEAALSGHDFAVARAVEPRPQRRQTRKLEKVQEKVQEIPFEEDKPFVRSIKL